MALFPNESGSGERTMAELHGALKQKNGNYFDRMIIHFDSQDKRSKASKEKIKNENNQRPAGLQLQA